MTTIDKNRRRQMRRVGAASLIGTTIEWYDYFIFGTAAALVFSKAFFPEASPTAGLLASFAVFAVGFLARPLGAVLFGHFGDKLGRKPMMVISLVLMGVATVLIGLLPTFQTIGVWAPVLLVTLRIVQGIGVGGEWGSAALMSVEHGSQDRRGFFGSLPAVGAPAGVLLSSGVFALVSSNMSDEAFFAWGWRIPFLLSAVLIAIGFIIRLAVEESPVFIEQRAAQEKKAPQRSPLLEVLKHHKKTVLLAAGTYMATAATFYIVSTWLVSYATAEVGFSRAAVLNITTATSAILIVSIVAFGSLSDKVGRRVIFITGSAGTALWVFPFFALVGTGHMALLIVAIGGVNVLLGMVAGTVASLFAELFDTRVRYSGASLSFQVASVLGGGFTPMIATALFAWAGSFWPIALYVIALNVLAILCVRAFPETFKVSLAPHAVVDDQHGEPSTLDKVSQR